MDAHGGLTRDGFPRPGTPLRAHSRGTSTAFAEDLRTSRSGVSWDRIFEQLAVNTSGQRVGTVEELASVALFITSDDSAFVNGVTILVDGGRGSLTPGTGASPS
jgi:NAD(P)-dependent dehydrogenase (short-subunit alcohol dehydrogenase family)